jgi:hypothetical protein
VEPFISKHADDVMGTLSGFDRLVLRGTLRMLAHRGGMMTYLWAVRVLLKDFAHHAQALTKQLREASEEAARRSGRPVRYLPSSVTNKEQTAREIAEADGITKGLICILTAVEVCLTYELVRDRESKHLNLVPRRRKCLYLYHYYIHPVLGFMHARIQTWFPFSIQICLNGREWLARSMDAARVKYVRRDNCFTWLKHPAQAQQLMDQQLRVAWPELLNGIARDLNPLHDTMFQAYPLEYYWSAYQTEWATDIMFSDTESLDRLYPGLVHHGLTTFLSPDVMRFLGRNVPPSGNIPPRLMAEVTSDVKRRPEGMRIKHRLGENSIKLYNKQGSVLRVETTINDASGFKSFRTPEGKPEAEKSWHRMRKGIADLRRRAETSQAANNRYLKALASVEDARSLGELTTDLCQPVRRDRRRARPLNPHAPDDARLFDAISRGEFTINGFRNRDLRELLFEDADASPRDQRRHAAAVSRKLALLRMHRLIRKVTGTHRYHLTVHGRIVVTALMTARNTSTQALTRLAA